MTIEEIKNLLENKLNRIEKCETQFFIGQKQQIADVLLLLSKLRQGAVSDVVCKHTRGSAKNKKDGTHALKCDDCEEILWQTER
jgi:hypothetical protein